MGVLASPSRRRLALLCLLAGCAIAPAVFAQAAPPPLGAAEIVQKNNVARGGLEAWQRLQTMAWTGVVESDAAPVRKLPFLLEQKRPNKTRFELITDGQRSVRVYDGRGGWKLRVNPANGRPELLPYNDDELKYARGAPVIDGPLMDCVAKGGVVTLAGHGLVDGRAAYILEVKLPVGDTQRLWVDAETYLELRQDRQLRTAAGQGGTVTVLFRDYREFEGVQIPTRIETGRVAGTSPNTLIIERVALNPELEDRAFARPDTPVSHRNSVIIDTRGAAHRGSVPAPAPRP
jgi:outer membrane lipoprotein-sorting protein